MSSIRPLRSMLTALHQERLSNFPDDLQRAVEQIVPTDFERYQTASILSFTWSNDKMGVNILRDELLNTLQRVYGFKAETHVLDANDTQVNVGSDFRDRLIDFTKTPKTDAKHLKVFYYSGHSDSGPYDDQLRLGGTVRANGTVISPFIDWYDFSSLALRVPRCHTLLIMDSCNAAMAGIHPDGEILTATGWEATTSAITVFRFTRVLIDEINSLNGRAFTACDMHSMMLTRAFTNNLSATPIHKADMSCHSVLVHKIDTREAGDLARASLTNTAKVLITVSIDKYHLPNIDDWTKWLTANMPTDLRDVEIIAHWRASSGVTLVSIPIQLWDYIQDDPGYNFVSFVLGKVHQGLPYPPQPSASLVQLQGAGKENQLHGRSSST